MGNETESVHGIILLADNPAFNREEPYNIALAGKPMKEWVKLAFASSPVTEIVYREDDGSVPAFVKPYLTDSIYTAVLFSDTPLFQRKTLLEILQFADAQRLNVCRLTRGWIFRTSFLKNSTNVLAVKTYYFDEEDFLTVSDFRQASLISDVLRQRILNFHMGNGVHVTDTAGVHIDGDVKIGRNVTIYNDNALAGHTVIEDGAVLRAHNVIEDCTVGRGADIAASVLRSSTIGANSRIGPYAYIRPGSNIGENCRIGNFVEVKNSNIGSGTKAAHLAYIGDADIGKNCNVGCGAVFVNYDGKNKHRSVVGDGVFIGSNANLVAPVKLGAGSFVAAGGTVTDDVPSESLAIARARQVNKADWVKKGGVKKDGGDRKEKKDGGNKNEGKGGGKGKKGGGGKGKGAK